MARNKKWFIRPSADYYVVGQRQKVREIDVHRREREKE
jgi:hypothetical protein